MFFTRCILLISLLCSGLPSTWAKESSTQLLRVAFYDQYLELPYPEELARRQRIRFEELPLRRLFGEFERRPYHGFLGALVAQAEELRLNDWLFAELVREALAELYQEPSTDPLVTYTTYFFLAKSGYDVRLTYRDQQLYVNAYTRDVIYEVPMIEEDGRKYANISARGEAASQRRSIYLLDQRPTPNGRPFRFELTNWPQLMTESRERTVSFQFRGHIYEIGLRYQAGLAQLLESYPLVNEYWYLDAPLSPELSRTLVPQLSRLMEGLNLRGKLELLVAFTRSGFVYQDDKQTFGGNKPMVPDELFFYPYSDCEDRSALFYGLVKTLLELPMIVIAYDDHLTIAVAAPGLQGDRVKYDGKSFLFCDPTGPQTSSEIGQIPNGYEKRSFEVIGYYPGE